MMVLITSLLKDAPTSPSLAQMATTKFHLINAGWKGGQNPKADLYIDCRGIPNPFHILSLAGKTGDDPAVQQWVQQWGQEHIDAAYQAIMASIPQIPERRVGEADPFERPYVVCFMCAHGIHRSRAMKHILAGKLKAGQWKVEVK